MGAPSRYGPDDTAGALNEITPDAVLAAVALVRTGTVRDLAHELHDGIPVFPGRRFEQRLAENPDRPLGTNAVHWVAERITATQQLGTHLDALNHLQAADRTYGGHRLADILTPYGTSRLGVETLPQVVTRGVLLDIARQRGVDALDAGDVVTVADAQAALDVAGLDLRPGDAVFFHTGWGALWDTDGARYVSAEPGPGIDVARWLVGHRVALTGCDTWSYGPYPAEDPDRPFAVPQWLNVHHGVVVAENLRLAEAAAAGLTEFLLVVSHAKIRGATGAWVCPLAIT